VVSSPPATEEIGAMGCEIEYRRGISLKNTLVYVSELVLLSKGNRPLSTRRTPFFIVV
jgi:hypothetical protein